MRERSRSLRPETLWKECSLLLSLFFLLQFSDNTIGIAHAQKNPESVRTSIIEADTVGENHPIEASFLEIIKASAFYEPARVYPILEPSSVLPVDYMCDRGFVSTLSEETLVSAFGQVSMNTTMAWFSNKENTSWSNFYPSQSDNIDPLFHPDKTFHLGIDLKSQDRTGENTYLVNPFRSIYRGQIHLSRFGNEVLFTQLVGDKDQELRVKIGNEEYFVFVLYGHLLPETLPQKKNGEVLSVGEQLGDITANRLVGTSTGPHVHMEIIAIPVSEIGEGGGATLYVASHQWEILIRWLTLSPDFFLDHLSSDPTVPTGNTQQYRKVMKDGKTRMQILRALRQ
jgi:hypothetical protein